MKIVSLYIEHPIMELNTTFSYYLEDNVFCCRGMRVKVDFNGQKIIGFVDKVEECTDVIAYQNKVGYQLKKIEDIIDKEPLLNDELYDLGLWLSYTTISPAISCFQCMLPSSLKPLSSAKGPSKEKWVRIINQQIKEKYGFIDEQIKLQDFLSKVSSYFYNKYKKTAQIEVYEKEKQANISFIDIKRPNYSLTIKQQEALREINGSENHIILLHGITGSGKTEIYMSLTEQAVLAGNQVLILVPEISLTPQIVERFSKRFGNNIAFYHSGLSNSEKYQQYQLVKKGLAKIVIGTRSAIFLPFEKLGLIVMDEEHDNSYKQSSKPTYNCRDVAIKRANHHHCKLILGSATPSLDSYARGLKGLYKLVRLDSRISTNLPESHLIDMSKQMRLGNYILSQPLTQAIKERLDNHKQVILLLNRRGYTPIMKCGYCGYTKICPHCDIAMSYHKDENKMVCHCCGHSESIPDNCPHCGHNNWRNYGLGTQRLVEEINSLFPQAKVVRMDADSTKSKDSHSQIINDFGQGKYDIMIGTQMISKGLDYPNVTLVGIFNADAPLAHSDYRSVETTFDLIVQASGRSGRSNEKGEVYVQAYEVNHYGIVTAIRQDYETFFNNEMHYRQIGKYPPYSNVIAIQFASRDSIIPKDNAQRAADEFRKITDLRVLGPSELLKKKDEYRYRVILKDKNKEHLLKIVWDWYNKQQINKSSLRLSIDVDPYVLE